MTEPTQVTRVIGAAVALGRHVVNVLARLLAADHTDRIAPQHYGPDLLPACTVPALGRAAALLVVLLAAMLALAVYHSATAAGAWGPLGHGS